MGRTHRGQRSRIGTIHHLPDWARNLLWFLRTIPRNARETVLTALRSVIDIIEQEWSDDTPPVAPPSESITLEYNHDPSNTALASTNSTPVLPWQRSRTSQRTTTSAASTSTHARTTYHAQSTLDTTNQFEDPTTVGSRHGVVLPTTPVRQGPHTMVRLNRHGGEPTGPRSRSPVRRRCP